MKRCSARITVLPAVLAIASSFAATPASAPRATARAAQPPVPVQAAMARPCTSVAVDKPAMLTLGKSELIRLDFPAARLVVGGRASGRVGVPIPRPEAQPEGAPAAGLQQASDGVADTEITLLSPSELFFLGKKTGSMNIVLQSADGRCLVKDIVVTVDPAALQGKLAELLPGENGIRVGAADTSLVLTGTVTDLVKLDQAVRLAESYADGRKVVNLLEVGSPLQVMLEVKIAEVSKTLLDRFGLDFSRLVTSASGATSSIISGIIGGGPGVLGQFHPNISGGTVSGAAAGSVGLGSGSAAASTTSIGRGATMLGIDAQKKDGIIRVLAEPNIMAISGQAASFLSGGKIFIPVAQTQNTGGVVITLEEKEFGVGLKFTPTVLGGNRINLKLVSEASELQQTGSPFTTINGQTAILPSLSTRRVDTTVQLGDGQSFVVAGLVKNNMNEALTKFPGLGEVPVMGALFRSNEFQTDQTELMFVVTPRLVKPLAGPVALPTDNHVVPSRGDVFWMGSGESARQPAAARQANAPAPAPSTAAAPAKPASAQPVPTQGAPAPAVQTQADQPQAVQPPSPEPQAASPTQPGQQADAAPAETAAIASGTRPGY